MSCAQLVDEWTKECANKEIHPNYMLDSINPIHNYNPYSMRDNPRCKNQNPKCEVGCKIEEQINWKKNPTLTHTLILKMKRTWEFDGENQRKVPRISCVGD
jgi:hypothetical protein